MYFYDYKQHKEAQVRSSLLWEYSIDNFDWLQMRNVVVQRVIERGLISDYYAILNLYGLNGVKEGIKQIPVMSRKDISFVCNVFNIRKEQLKCCTEKPLRRQLGRF